MKSTLYITEVDKALNKETWERFWQIFNLTQITTKLIFGDEISESKFDKYECLQYHDIEYHDIVKQFIDNNIDFEKEGGFFVTYENGFAEAMLGLHKQKIFIHPLSEEDRKIFIQAGYTEIEKSNFNLNNLGK